MSMNYKEIGLSIKHFRKVAGLTQIQLAQKIGRTESSIRKYESGIVEIPMSILNEIAKVLNVPLREVLGLKDANGEYGLFNTFEETQGFAEEMAGMTRQARLLEGFKKLNEQGQIQAVESVELLTEIPRYKRQ